MQGERCGWGQGGIWSAARGPGPHRTQQLLGLLLDPVHRADLHNRGHLHAQLLLEKLLQRPQGQVEFRVGGGRVLRQAREGIAELGCAPHQQTNMTNPHCLLPGFSKPS